MVALSTPVFNIWPSLKTGMILRQVQIYFIGVVITASPGIALGFNAKRIPACKASIGPQDAPKLKLGPINILIPSMDS